jgi:hypothetical protein
MTESEFMSFFNTYLKETIIPTMIGKGLGQYSNQEDRFHNFKCLSQLEMETKEKCLSNLVAKQIVGLYDQIREWEKQKGFPATPHFFTIVDEVIKDIIIYMFLLRGMFYEYQQTETTNPWATTTTLSENPFSQAKEVLDSYSRKSSDRSNISRQDRPRFPE